MPEAKTLRCAVNALYKLCQKCYNAGFEGVFAMCFYLHHTPSAMLDSIFGAGCQGFDFFMADLTLPSLSPYYGYSERGLRYNSQ